MKIKIGLAAVGLLWIVIAAIIYQRFVAPSPAALYGEWECVSGNAPPTIFFLPDGTLLTLNTSKVQTTQGKWFAEPSNALSGRVTVIQESGVPRIQEYHISADHHSLSLVYENVKADFTQK